MACGYLIFPKWLRLFRFGVVTILPEATQRRYGSMFGRCLKTRYRGHFGVRTYNEWVSMAVTSAEVERVATGTW